MADTSLCPGCGSMLPLPDLDGHATCPSCGRTTRSEPTRSSPPAERAPDGPADAVGASSVDAPETGGPRADGPDDALAATLAAAGQRPLRPPPDWSERSRPGRGCVIAAFAGVVLFVAGVAVFAFSSAQDDLRARLDPSYSPYDDLLVLGGTAQLLDVGGDGPEVIVTVQETDGGDLVRRLARIRFADGEAEVVWQSGPIADDAHRAQVAAYDDTLFVGIDREVAALELDTGETRWRAEVRDDVASGCEGCFAVVGGRLVVRTADAYLTAFGPASSEQQWSRRLGSVAASTSVAGDRLVVVDEPEAPGVAASAVVVDPATGRDGAATSPSCPAPEWSPRPLGLSVGDEVHAVPGSDDVVAAFGFGDGCVARWNPDDRSVRWATPVEGVSSIDDDAVVVDEAVMAFAETGGGVVAVDLETGAVATMELPPDAAATPALVVDGVLVGDTVSSRGTRRGGLAGWDPATGALEWTAAVPRDAEPIERDRYATTVALFDGSPRSVVVPTDAGVSILVFDGGDRTWSATPVSVADGRVGTEVRRDLALDGELGIPSLGVVGVVDGRVVVTLDRLLESLPATGGGEVVTFPPPD